MIKKAIILSLSGQSLTKNEKKLFTKKNIPWGIILFKRNIKNFNQLKKLISSLQRITKDKNYPILIDEEGGTVTRLQSIFLNKLYSQRFFGKLYESNPVLCINIYKLYITSICKLFKKLGININTTPVMDRLYPQTHFFLKERIFSSRISIIKKLSDICIKTYKKNKISNVIKHIPGHGLSKIDSHKKLPTINKNLKFLLKNDFNCFRNTSAQFAMTAHILFKKIDKYNCVTHSEKIIKKIIRKKIGFKGIIISDDISMKSLKYDIFENALKAIKSGCNLALYCKGVYKDSSNLLQKIPPIDEFTKKKTSAFYKFLR